MLAAAYRVALGRPALNGDVINALVWGQTLAAGRTPAYADGPTPHPFSNAVGALLSVLGAGGALQASELLAYVAFGALIVTTAVLARVAFASTRVAVLAACILATEYGLVARASVGFYDIPALVFAGLALITGMRRPDRNVQVAGWLTLSGLIRPEYWLILALYALGCSTRRSAARACGRSPSARRRP